MRRIGKLFAGAIIGVLIATIGSYATIVKIVMESTLKEVKKLSAS